LLLGGIIKMIVLEARKIEALMPIAPGFPATIKKLGAAGSWTIDRIRPSLVSDRLGH
jgi:hypothetical protein